MLGRKVTAIYFQGRYPSEIFTSSLPRVDCWEFQKLVLELEPVSDNLYFQSQFTLNSDPMFWVKLGLPLLLIFSNYKHGDDLEIIDLKCSHWGRSSSCMAGVHIWEVNLGTAKHRGKSMTKLDGHSWARPGTEPPALSSLGINLVGLLASELWGNTRWPFVMSTALGSSTYSWSVTQWIITSVFWFSSSSFSSFSCSSKVLIATEKACVLQSFCTV